MTDASCSSWFYMASTIISGAVALGVAKIGVSQHRDKKENERREIEAVKREALRNEGALLQMEMIDATLDLSLVTAKTVQMKKTNGDVEDAFDKAVEVQGKVADFFRRASQSI